MFRFGRAVRPLGVEQPKHGGGFVLAPDLPSASPTVSYVDSDNSERLFLKPKGLAKMRDGNILVANSGHNNIVILDPTGRKVGTIGVKKLTGGAGQDEFDNPCDVTVYGDGFAINDEGNDRAVYVDGGKIQMMPRISYKYRWEIDVNDPLEPIGTRADGDVFVSNARTGATSRAVAYAVGKSVYCGPYPVVLDDYSHCVVIDASDDDPSAKQAYVFRSDRSLLTSMRFPCGDAYACEITKGALFVSDTTNDRIVIIRGLLPNEQSADAPFGVYDPVSAYGMDRSPFDDGVTPAQLASRWTHREAPRLVARGAPEDSRTGVEPTSGTPAKGAVVNWSSGTIAVETATSPRDPESEREGDKDQERRSGGHDQDVSTVLDRDTPTAGAGVGDGNSGSESDGVVTMEDLHVSMGVESPHCMMLPAPLEHAAELKPDAHERSAESAAGPGAAGRTPGNVQSAPPYSMMLAPAFDSAQQSGAVTPSSMMPPQQQGSLDSPYSMMLPQQPTHYLISPADSTQQSGAGTPYSMMPPPQQAPYSMMPPPPPATGPAQQSWSETPYSMMPPSSFGPATPAAVGGTGTVYTTWSPAGPGNAAPGGPVPYPGADSRVPSAASGAPQPGVTSGSVAPTILVPLGPPSAPPSQSIISKEEAKDLLKAEVAKHCCWGKGPADLAEIGDISASSDIKIEVNTLYEERTIVMKERPHNGGHVSQSIHGGDMHAALKRGLNSVHGFYNPWSYNVTPPPHVTGSSVHRSPITGTEMLVNCQTCGGVGNYMCKECQGRGQQSCFPCHGTGRKQSGEGAGFAACPFCKGTRTQPCGTCRAAGRIQCRPCNMTGKRVKWAELEVWWRPNQSDCFVSPSGDLSPIPARLLRGVSGVTLMSLEGQSVEPARVSMAPPVTQTHIHALLKSHAYQPPSHDLVVARARESAAGDHVRCDLNPEYTGRILQQRVLLEGIPVFTVPYTAKGKPLQFHVYGLDRHVFAGDYPSTCCGCCSIL